MIAESSVVTSSDGITIGTYFARPLTSQPVGGVVLFHHRPGWDEWYREATRRFAHHGYNALCPNLYHRFGHGEPDDIAAKVRAEGDVPDVTVVQDGLASVSFLRGLPTSNGRVALMGTCSGGRHAYLTACHSADTDAVDAIVDCWGGRIVMRDEDLSDRCPVAPIDLTSQLPCPVLGLFGNDDGAPSPAEVDAHERALQASGKRYEFHRYEGAGHGFFYDDRPAAYRAQAAIDGWAKIWAFLSRTVSEP